VRQGADLFVFANEVCSVLSFHASAAASPTSASADDTVTETRQRCRLRREKSHRPCQMLCAMVSGC
jgi:hypothetical protein